MENSELKHFFDCEYSDQQEAEIKDRLLDDASVEGEMFRAFKTYRENVKSTEVNHPKSLNFQYWPIAAAILLLAVALIFKISIFDTPQELYSDWSNYSSFEKLETLNQTRENNLDQQALLRWFAEEKNVNVKISILKLIDEDQVNDNQIRGLLESENSPLIQSTMKFLITQNDEKY